MQCVPRIEKIQDQPTAQPEHKIDEIGILAWIHRQLEREDGGYNHENASSLDNNTD